MGAFISFCLMPRKASSHSAVHLKWSPFWEALCKSSNITTVWHKVSVITSCSQECFQRALILGDWPLPYDFHFLWICRNAIPGHQVISTTTFSDKSLYFLRLIFKPASERRDRTSLSRFSYKVRPKMMMSSRCTRQSDQHKPFKTRCIALTKHAGAFLRPKLNLRNW